MGCFASLFLFIRFMPMISIFEMRTLLPEAEVGGAPRMSGDARLCRLVAEFDLRKR
jgi:hypothetical protein